MFDIEYSRTRKILFLLRGHRGHHIALSSVAAARLHETTFNHYIHCIYIYISKPITNQLVTSNLVQVHPQFLAPLCKHALQQCNSTVSTERKVFVYGSNNGEGLFTLHSMSFLVLVTFFSSASCATHKWCSNSRTIFAVKSPVHLRLR